MFRYHIHDRKYHSRRYQQDIGDGKHQLASGLKQTGEKIAEQLCLIFKYQMPLIPHKIPPCLHMQDLLYHNTAYGKKFNTYLNKKTHLRKPQRITETANILSKLNIKCIPACLAFSPYLSRMLLNDAFGYRKPESAAVSVTSGFVCTVKSFENISAFFL